MITKFSSLYAGHVDLGDMGQDATPANDRRYSSEHLNSVFSKTEALAACMDGLGYDTLYYEEHAKMFAPLGFFRGLTDEQLEAVARRGGWDAHGIPTIDQAMGARSWYCGPAEGMIAYLKELEESFPGLEMVNVQSSMGTPEDVMIEQLERFADEVMPAFRAR